MKALLLSILLSVAAFAQTPPPKTVSTRATIPTAKLIGGLLLTNEDSPSTSVVCSTLNCGSLVDLATRLIDLTAREPPDPCCKTVALGNSGLAFVDTSENPPGKSVLPLQALPRVWVYRWETQNAATNTLLLTTNLLLWRNTKWVNATAERELYPVLFEHMNNFIKPFLETHLALLNADADSIPEEKKLARLLYSQETSPSVTVLSTDADDLELKLREMHKLASPSGTHVLALPGLKGVAFLIASRNGATLNVYRWKRAGVVSFVVSMNVFRWRPSPDWDNWENQTHKEEMQSPIRELMLGLKQAIERRN